MAYISKSILLFVMLVLFIIPVQSQVHLDWAACYNGPGNGPDYPLAVHVDDSGYVYVTGTSRRVSSFNNEFVSIKYTPNGYQLWIQTYYGPISGTYVGRDIITDDLGNIYVTGTITTLKYNKDGSLLWLNQMPLYSEGKRMSINNDRLIVTGTSLDDYMILSYDLNGNLLWEQYYNGIAGSSDWLEDMVIDSKGNIIVTGQSHGIGTHWDYATVKFSPEGNSLWVRRYNGPCSSFPGDYPYSMTVDDEDNVYVTGRSDGANCNAECFTIAYSSTGDTLWEARYSGYTGYDVIYSNGFIYVNALVTGMGILLKYDRQGNLVQTITGLPSGSYQNTRRMVTDKNGYIYVSGTKNYSFTVSKVSPSDTIVWEYQFPGLSTPPGCFLSGITIDKFDNIYLTGDSHYGSICSGGQPNYLTVKISQGKMNIDPGSELADRYELFQNYPNPFNPETTIRFALPKSEFVELKVYDLLGREIKTLISEERTAGIHNIIWNAEGLASGVYYYRITAGEFSQTRKLILLR